MTTEVSTSAVEFRFPDIHEDARLMILLHQTLRVPDDDTSYGLPPGLGDFDVRPVASLRSRNIPATWSTRDAVMPMWQSEACWMSFVSSTGYPFLVKVGAGNINAVTGGEWSRAPDFTAEDYVEVPEQPWLDGFCVDENTVRQFVAMPLGDGYTVDEQLNADQQPTGGIRFAVYPLKAEVWEERRALPPEPIFYECAMSEAAPAGEMGLGAGGSITQSIATPIEPHENWNLDVGETMDIRIVNSVAWQTIAGAPPHTEPLTIAQYLEHGYPWFDWYDDSLARQGSSELAGVKTVKEIGEQKGEQSLPDNESFDPPTPIVVGP